jgi:formamidopyrimidine-DNA glycosylase
MPELPEVETIRRGLARSVTGKRIEEIEIFDPVLVRQPKVKAFIRRLKGRTITRVARRGKVLLLHLDDGMVWAVHLRMTGRMLYHGKQKPEKDRALRARLTLRGVKTRTEARSYLWFSDTRRFGEWYLVSRAEEVPLISRMGPEPLEVSRDEFTRRIKEKERQIKALLLDQAFLGGVGNIYACEALYRAGIHPRRISSDLSYNKINKLYDGLKAVLEASIQAGGSSVRNYRRSDGKEGWFALRLEVYGKEGEPCPRCGGRIVRKEIGSRGTFFCPGCQK